MKCRAISVAMLILVTTIQGTALAQTRDEKVLADRSELTDDDRWIYNDLPAGFAEARQANKPLLIVFR